ncbi:hypothetical protein [Thauera sp. WH-1]|uniref:hypothetical protein n=1 Tax=Thauera sp. WH-1 TaxID=3398230 RepID=UPI0039FD16D9
MAAWLLSLLTGCVMLENYGDDALPESERAIVEGYWHYRFIYDEELHIASVDGRREGGRSGWPYAYSVSLPSGQHWLQIAILRNSGAIAGCAFAWTFEAGHHYKLQRLRHDQFLLAHPATERFRATLDVVVTAPDGVAQPVSVPAVCGKRLMCRGDADCPAGQSCLIDAEFEFGACVPGG